MVRYYGSYSNVARGKRKKKGQDDLIDSILEPDSPSREYKRNWARLIQKIYEVDPLTCPKCQGRMRVNEHMAFVFVSMDCFGCLDASKAEALSVRITTQQHKAKTGKGEHI